MNKKAAREAQQLVAEAAATLGAVGLAEILGCTRQAVYLWANGERTVPGWVVIALQQERSTPGKRA